MKLPKTVASVVSILLLVFALMGCNIVHIPSRIPPGGGVWVVLVDNKSDHPAVLQVAEDDPGGPGAIVGTAEPDTVPPETSVEVTFRLPPMQGWAIFVNAEERGGPLILPDDIPRPDLIEIDKNGVAGWMDLH